MHDDWWWLRAPGSDLRAAPGEQEAAQGFGLGAVHLMVTLRPA